MKKTQKSENKEKEINNDWYSWGNAPRSGKHPFRP